MNTHLVQHFGDDWEKNRRIQENKYKSRMERQQEEARQRNDTRQQRTLTLLQYYDRYQQAGSEISKLRLPPDEVRTMLTPGGIKLARVLASGATDAAKVSRLTADKDLFRGFNITSGVLVEIEDMVSKKYTYEEIRSLLENRRNVRAVYLLSKYMTMEQAEQLARMMASTGVQGNQLQEIADIIEAYLYQEKPGTFFRRGETPAPDIFRPSVQR